MTSRIPPSRRDPQYASQRAAKVVQQQTPGAGRVAGVAREGVSQAVEAALRGRPVPTVTGGSGLAIVDPDEPTSPATGQLWYDDDATC